MNPLIEYTLYISIHLATGTALLATLIRHAKNEITLGIQIIIIITWPIGMLLIPVALCAKIAKAVAKWK